MAFGYRETSHGFTCFWRIKNFNITRPDFDCSYKSATFKVPMLKSSRWRLELKHTRYISLGLYLYKDADCWEKSNIDLQMSILTSTGWRTKLRDSLKFKPGGTGKGTALLVDWDRCYNRNKLVRDGYLTVSCHMSNESTWGENEQCFIASEVDIFGLLLHSPILHFFDLKPEEVTDFPAPHFRVLEGCTFCEKNKKRGNDQREIRHQKIIETKSSQTECNEESNICSDSEEIIRLFKDKKFQFVTLSTPPKDFVVNKILLSARSPVFKAMFQEHKKENGRRIIIQIDDVDTETLSLLLQLLHLESMQLADLDWDAVVKLFYAADKYQIEELKKECGSFLKTNSTEENVCDATILDYIAQEEKIQKVDVLENICENTESTSHGNWCF